MCLIRCDINQQMKTKKITIENECFSGRVAYGALSVRLKIKMFICQFQSLHVAMVCTDNITIFVIFCCNLIAKLSSLFGFLYNFDIAKSSNSHQ